MTTIAVSDTLLDEISQVEANVGEGSPVSDVTDLRTELIEALWIQWVNCLADEAAEQRQRLREVAADFALAIR